MGKLLAIGIAVALATAAYVAHARNAAVGEVAHCLQNAGARVQVVATPRGPMAWASLGDGDVYAIKLDRDRGTLLHIGREVDSAQVQRALDAAGTHVTSQSDGRTLVLWSGRPAASSAAALNRCLRA